jgi:hypothetical protein
MFRPAFEILERREVFSADLLVASTLFRSLDNYGVEPMEQVSLNFAGRGENSAGVTADNMYQGLGKVAAAAPQLDGARKNAVFTRILPFIEQDNLYKLTSVAGADVNCDGRYGNLDSLVDDIQFPRESTHDLVFERIGAERQQGIIAVLIGL